MTTKWHVVVKWLLSGMLLLLIAIAAGGWVLRAQYHGFLDQPLDIQQEGQVVTIAPGMSNTAVVRHLAAQGMTQWNWKWRLLMRLQAVQLKAGEYLLEAGLTPVALLGKLQAGDVIFYRFTIVEGWTFQQLLDALQRDAMLANSAADPEALKVLASTLTDHANPEGWFLPETYQFSRGYSAADLLQRAYQDMQLVLQRAWHLRHPDHPVSSPYELLILASIIERETAVEDERAEISGVFVRRLNKGMRLQTDPTIIYGMGESFDGDIRKKDLLTDTPYNTYTRHGLPPTPIALPGEASLLAAAQPLEGSSLYFVANGQGGHTFSDTFEEHQKAVNIMLGRKP